MATDATSFPTAASIGARAVVRADHWTTYAAELLRPLASLRLTVTLFALSIVLVFVGTLAQEKETMWDVLSHYFRTWVAWVPLDVFFPDSFFPKLPTIPGKFPFPGGWSIGLLLGLNLFAAHATRFKVQAKGGRLYAGLGIIAAGVALTICRGGQWQCGGRRARRQPSILGDDLGILSLDDRRPLGGSVFWVLRTPVGNKARFWLRAAVSGLLGLTAFWLIAYGGSTRISDSSLRILWQLAQGLGAGLVLLVGQLAGVPATRGHCRDSLGSRLADDWRVGGESRGGRRTDADQGG